MTIELVDQTRRVPLPVGGLGHLVGSLRAQAVELAAAYGIAVPVLRHVVSPVASAYLPPPHVDLVLVVLDSSDEAGALGYHSEMGGVPYARVFTADCLEAGVAASSCLSHEVCEALADPFVNLWAADGDGVLHAYEICDPVESTTYLDAHGVALSNYVLPGWFDPTVPTGAPVDRQRALAVPFQIGAGGYAVVWDGSGVRQVFGGEPAPIALAPGKMSELGRTARRLAVRPG